MIQVVGVCRGGRVVLCSLSKICAGGNTNNGGGSYATRGAQANASDSVKLLSAINSISVINDSDNKVTSRPLKKCLKPYHIYCVAIKKG